MTEKDKKPNMDDDTQKGNPNKWYIQSHYKKKIKTIVNIHFAIIILANIKNSENTKYLWGCC